MFWFIVQRCGSREAVPDILLRQSSTPIGDDTCLLLAAHSTQVLMHMQRLSARSFCIVILSPNVGSTVYQQNSKVSFECICVFSLSNFVCWQFVWYKQTFKVQGLDCWYLRIEWRKICTDIYNCKVNLRAFMSFLVFFCDFLVEVT